MSREDIILRQIWSDLNSSLKIRNHPFHIFSVATINNKIKPDIRNVVLRDVDELSNTISFHTDIRSKKIDQIINNSDVCALFYNQKEKIQLRLYGKIYAVKDKCVLKERWNKSKNMSKLCYLNKYPPGEKILSAKDYLPDDNDLENIDNGLKNFSILNINIQSIDWLNLSYKGHERMIIEFFDNSNVKFKWVAP